MAVQAVVSAQLEKAPTGIDGFDEITFGGVPKGRPTLVCGSAGCGKTLFAMEFLVRGATEFGEPGVFVAFEESAHDLTQNVSSLGFNLEDLQAQNLLRIDHIEIDRSEIEESGEYDLSGLFIRLNYFIDQIGAKRVVLDTIETIFSGLSNAAILRNELQRLFRWLKDKGVTAVITGERGDGTLTRQGLEEYVSDCVIVLDHRVIDQVSTRRLRVVKYRGTYHGTNEYPFLIDRDGFSVLPVTSLGLQHGVSDTRVSTGIASLDEMMGGEGYYKGSSVLLSGAAGTGKSSVAALFAQSTCLRGEKCVYFAFEESKAQIVRNMRSIGVDLQPYIDNGLLTIQSTRPMHFGLETHLATMQKLIAKLKPAAVIVDPVSNLTSIATFTDIGSMLIRLVDYLKANLITGLFVSLTGGGESLESSHVGLSSVMDAWLLVREIETNGERNRGMYVLKARGTNHSNQIREFIINSEGVELRDVYLGPEGVLTGSSRIAQQAREEQEEAQLLQDLESKRVVSEQRKRAIEAQIVALQAQIIENDTDLESMENKEKARLNRIQLSQGRMSAARKRGLVTKLEKNGGGR